MLQEVQSIYNSDGEFVDYSNNSPRLSREDLDFYCVSDTLFSRAYQSESNEDNNEQPKKKQKKEKEGQFVCDNCNRIFTYKHTLTYHMENRVCKRIRRDVDVEDLTLKPHEMIGAAFNKCLEELRKLRLQNASERRARYDLL